jgi:DNA-binding CsgD family transcriptional regulator
VRAARLIVYSTQATRERRIFALLAEGHTQKQTAGHLGLKLRSISAALGNMRNRYTAPTNESLIAIAVCLEWITIAVDCCDP